MLDFRFSLICLLTPKVRFLFHSNWKIHNYSLKSIFILKSHFLPQFCCLLEGIPTVFHELLWWWVINNLLFHYFFLGVENFLDEGGSKTWHHFDELFLVVPLRIWWFSLESEILIVRSAKVVARRVTKSEQCRGLDWMPIATHPVDLLGWSFQGLDLQNGR